MNSQAGVGTTLTDRPTARPMALAMFLRAEKLRSGGAVAFSCVPRRIHQRRDGNSRDIFVGRWRVAAIAEHPGKDAELRGRPNRHRVVVSEEA